jgi:uncharacterized protein (DUF1499 family)
MQLKCEFRGFSVKAAFILILLTGAITAWGLWKNFSRPELGLVKESLLPCTGLPNCVSSGARDEKHYIAPLPGKPDALDKIAEILKNYPNVRIVEQTSSYLRAEARSPLFGFRDDLEFYYPHSAPVVHLRSSSRVGYSDMGVNRARLEKLRIEYKQQ